MGIKGDKKTIQHLNTILKNELTAINQYFIHSRMLKHWGINKLADYEYEESIEEMKHADVLCQRIFLLGGLPNMQDLNKLLIGQNVKEIIECDGKLEEKAIQDLRDAISHADDVQDHYTSDMLVQILGDEEKHAEHVQAMLLQIEQMGLENFIQTQI